MLTVARAAGMSVLVERLQSRLQEVQHLREDR